MQSRRPASPPHAGATDVPRVPCPQSKVQLSANDMRPVAVIIGGIQAALVFSILLRPTKALIVPPYRGQTTNSMGWRAVVRAAQ